MDYPIRIRVRGLHIDYFGHVNNCQYLEYLEEARWARYHDSFTGLMEQGFSWPIVNININFRKPSFLGDILVVTAELVSVKRCSCLLHQEIRREPDGEVIAEADVTCVIIENASGKAVPITGDILQAIQVEIPQAC